MTNLDTQIEALTPTSTERDVRNVLVILANTTFDEDVRDAKAEAIRRRVHMNRGTFKRLLRHTQPVAA